MLMVDTDSVVVERLLLTGELGCPSCGGVLRPWGHARWRVCRREQDTVRHRPRRASGGQAVLGVGVRVVDGVDIRPVRLRPRVGATYSTSRWVVTDTKACAVSTVRTWARCAVVVAYPTCWRT